MAIGKNKRISKGGKRGSKKKVIDPFSRKEWYLLKAPTMFKQSKFGNTLVSRSQGTKLAQDGLLGRVFEVNLADLQSDEDQSFRKMKLSCESVEGKTCYCDFHGMDMTRDHLCSLIKKWHTLIEAHCNVKTQDGYHLRMFAIAFTKRKMGHKRATCYAQTTQVKAIRAQMVEIMTAEASKCPLRELVQKFIPGSISKSIQKACHKIYPLDHIHIRKVKVLKKPKTDIAKLMEMHEPTAGDSTWAAVTESSDAQNLLTAEIKS